MPAGQKTSANSGDAHGGVVDVHVHCYPDEVIENPVAWADAHGEAHWGSLVTQGPQGWADPEDLLRAMDRDGIEKVLLQAWYWEKPETARRQNEWHAQWLDRHPDRMENPLEELESARKWGACAVGECLPLVQTDQGWSHPAWEHILHWTTREGWPLCVHLTEPVGHAYPGRIETPLHRIIERFETHPDQKWICAHWGGGLPFYSLNRRVDKALRNVWFDTAASPLLYNAKVWKTVCDLIGAEKILFGSDFPLLLYPRRHRTPGWIPFLEEFHASGISVSDRRKIARGNFETVMGG